MLIVFVGGGRIEFQSKGEVWYNRAMLVRCYFKWVLSATMVPLDHMQEAWVESPLHVSTLVALVLRGWLLRSELNSISGGHVSLQRLWQFVELFARDFVLFSFREKKLGLSCSLVSVGDVLDVYILLVKVFCSLMKLRNHSSIELFFFHANISNLIRDSIPLCWIQLYARGLCISIKFICIYSL